MSGGLAPAPEMAGGVIRAGGASLLAPLAALYGAGVRLRLRLHERGLLRQRRLPGFVLSVGNLTAGGTGKTPAVISLAKWARAQGHRVAVLSRGYRGKYRGEVLEVSDGARIRPDFRLSGDEPQLLARSLPGIPVILSRKRFLAGRYAREKFGTDFFILDDGFQHLGLRRDLDLVLLDCRDPFGNGRLLPGGPLREPVGQLVRADVFALTRCESSDSGREVEAFLGRAFPGTPVCRARHRPCEVVFPGTGARHEPGFAKGRRILAFAGIARPEHFRAALLQLGAELVGFRAFPDHHPISAAEVRSLIRRAKTLKADFLLTTEKDWVRISRHATELMPIGYLGIEFAWLSGGQSVAGQGRGGAEEAHPGLRSRTIGNHAIDRSRIQRILVASTNWVGDGVMTLPALEAVRRNFPSGALTVLARPWVAPLFEHHPAVDHILVAADGGGAWSRFLETLQLARFLRQERFDLAVLFPNAFRAAALTCLGGVTHRVGYDTDGRGFLLTRRIVKDERVLRAHQVDGYLGLLRALGWEAERRDPELSVTTEEVAAAEARLKAAGLGGDCLRVGLGPGAIFGQAKRWPAERFAVIGDWVAARWGGQVLVFGSRKEAEICGALEQSMGSPVLNLAGRTSLREAMALIHCCHLFLTNDSGLMHVAAALGVPTVAIFGSTDPIATGPRGRRTRVVRHAVECAPCLKPACATDYRCLLSIRPEEVWEAMESLRGQAG